MEQVSPPDPESNKAKILEAQIRECYGRVVWSHKTQEKCSDLLTNRHNLIKMWQIILAAATTTSFLVTVFGSTKAGAIIGTVMSTLLFGLNMYTKNYDLAGIAKIHSLAASDLWNIRESYLSLLTDIRSESISIDDIKRRRDELQECVNDVYKNAPRTDSKAYCEATKALKLNEELTFSDDEINAFLPKELHKSEYERST